MRLTPVIAVVLGACAFLVLDSLALPDRLTVSILVFAAVFMIDTFYILFEDWLRGS